MAVLYIILQAIRPRTQDHGGTAKSVSSAGLLGVTTCEGEEVVGELPGGALSSPKAALLGINDPRAAP